MTNKTTILEKMNGRTDVSGASGKIKRLTETLEVLLGLRVMRHPYAYCGIKPLRTIISDLKEVGYEKEERRSYITRNGYRDTLGFGASVITPVVASVLSLIAEEPLNRYVDSASTAYYVSSALAFGFIVGILPAAAYSYYKSTCASELLHDVAVTNRKYKTTRESPQDMENLGIESVGDKNLISRMARQRVCDKVKRYCKINVS